MFWARKEEVGETIKIIASDELINRYYGRENVKIKYGKEYKIVGHVKFITDFMDMYGVLLENGDSVLDEFISFDLKSRERLINPRGLFLKILLENNETK